MNSFFLSKKEKNGISITLIYETETSIWKQCILFSLSVGLRTAKENKQTCFKNNIYNLLRYTSMYGNFLLFSIV